MVRAFAILAMFCMTPPLSSEIDQGDVVGGGGNLFLLVQGRGNQIVMAFVTSSPTHNWSHTGLYFVVS